MEQISYVDSKLKKIYKEHLGYQELSLADQFFFDSIFNILWFNEEENVILKNSYIAAKTGYSSSTVEKKFRRLERAGLIVRTLERKFDYGVWTSVRTIRLDSDVKALLCKNLKLLPNHLINKEEILEQDNIEPTEDIKEEENEIKIENEKIKFILGGKKR